MSGFLRQFRKRGKKWENGTTGQPPREACMDPSESVHSQSSFDEYHTAASYEARVTRHRRWGRRRKRGVAVATSSNVEETKATPTPTPPVTPEKECFNSEIPSTSSTATTASPTSISTETRDGQFVPEEEVEAVRRALSGECSFDDDEDAWNAVTHAVAALDKAGSDLFAAGEYDAAFKRYERALQLKRNTLRTQGENDGELGHNRQQPVSRDASKSQSQQQRADVVASVATSINNMTYLQQRAGLLSADESLASYFKSLQMKRETLGPNHLSVGKTLNNIGSAFYLKKEYEPALQAYRDARRVMEANLGHEHGDVGTVVSNIGDVYFALEKNEEALEHYRSALNIRWASLGPSDVKVARLMQRIAAIETGKQPERDGDDSESDTDEYQDGDLKAILFKEDIQSLQEEIEEDMKYFDLVEREMALNMLKDKMRIFREMRELSMEGSDTLLSSESRSRTGVSNEARNVGANENPAAPLPQDDFVRTRSHSDGSIEAGVGANHRRYPKACSMLSSEDRERALCSVQKRLARLRADRNCVSESSGEDVLTLVECASRSNPDDTTKAFLTGSGSPAQRLFHSPRQAKA
jgi:tetratricopeptide (TPR) repeat protein